MAKHVLEPSMSDTVSDDSVLTCFKPKEVSLIIPTLQLRTLRPVSEHLAEVHSAARNQSWDVWSRGISYSPPLSFSYIFSKPQTKLPDPKSVSNKPAALHFATDPLKVIKMAYKQCAGALQSFPWGEVIIPVHFHWAPALTPLLLSSWQAINRSICGDWHTIFHKAESHEV
jgi:hypothetical protein